LKDAQGEDGEAIKRHEYADAWLLSSISDNTKIEKLRAISKDATFNPELKCCFDDDNRALAESFTGFIRFIQYEQTDTTTADAKPNLLRKVYEGGVEASMPHSFGRLITKDHEVFLGWFEFDIIGEEPFFDHSTENGLGTFFKDGKLLYSGYYEEG